jgi:hypothetical protein
MKLEDILANCFLSLFFDPENGSNIFLRNVGKVLPKYMLSHPNTANLLLRSVSILHRV